MTIIIKKRIPIPPNTANSKYGFHLMELDDCVDLGQFARPELVYQASIAYGRRNGIKFTRRGSMLWRIK